ncbi:glucosaminidase domain-containing protein [Mariniluteicoccus flavus]
MLRPFALALACVFALAGCAPETPKAPRTPRPTKQAQKVANARFIESVAPYAQEGEKTHGVPASIAIGQAILESGWGRSGLTIWGGAYFGIKCSRVSSRYQSGCVAQSSLEYDASASPRAEVSSFRTYASPRDSFADHGDFLRTNPRYADAFRTKDPQEFVTRIHRAGYATDPGYPQLVMSLVDAHDLRRFDQAALTNLTPPPAAPAGPVNVDGTIGEKYRQLGGPASPLGAPVGGEADGPNGMTLVVFERGIILWTNAHGAFPLTGPAWALYRSDPALRDRLGAPIDGATDTSVPFENGKIVVENGKARAA